MQTSACCDHPNPPAIDTATDSCIDRLVKADVAEISGTRLNPVALPADDTELFADLEAKQPSARAQLPPATSWSPNPADSIPGSLPAAPEASPAETVSPPIMSSSQEIAGIDPAGTGEAGFASALDHKQSRGKQRTQQERAHRQSVELQNIFHQQCRQLRLSDVECRLTLREQKVSNLGNSPNQRASSGHQQRTP